jgi:hypothetical protein
MATGGMQNLGGAIFTVTANTASFDAGMAKAEAAAKRAQKSIDGATAKASAGLGGCRSSWLGAPRLGSRRGCLDPTTKVYTR